MFNLPYEPTIIARQMAEKIASFDLFGISTRIGQRSYKFDKFGVAVRKGPVDLPLNEAFSAEELDSDEYKLFLEFSKENHLWIEYFGNMEHHGSGFPPVTNLRKFQEYFALWLHTELSLYAYGLQRMMESVYLAETSPNGPQYSAFFANKVEDIDTDFIRRAIIASNSATEITSLQDFLHDFSGDRQKRSISSKVWWYLQNFYGVFWCENRCIIILTDENKCYYIEFGAHYCKFVSNDYQVQHVPCDNSSISPDVTLDQVINIWQSKIYTCIRR
jgi:hypothetical protein